MNELQNSKCILGESPIWNFFTNSLFWVDILDKKIYEYNDYKIKKYKLDKKPTSIGVIDFTKIFLTLEDSVGTYDFRDQKYHEIQKIDLADGVRLNDGKCDRKGIYWVGGMDENNHKNFLYKYKNKTLNPILGSIGISNGLAWNKDNTKMYFSDSHSREIYSFDYTNENPDCRNLLYKSPDDSTPDGATIDNNDTLYSCQWGGSKILGFNNNKVKEISLPIRYPTSCCFGGKDMNIFFITSSSLLDKNIHNGKLFYCKIPNSIGIRETPVII